MADTPWTAGPWQKSGIRGRSPEYKGHGIGPDGDDYVVIVPYNDADHTECLANARLIAAAPEMAELLERWANSGDDMNALIDETREVLTRIRGEDNA